MTRRPYTGARPPYGRRQPGLEHFAGSVEYLTGGRLWNNGTLGIRPIRGGSSTSVHATGRAVDLSRRNMGGNRPGSDRRYLLDFIDMLIAHADAFGLELIVDYQHGRGGRTWRCDRGTWLEQKPGAIAGGGASWADWMHVELSPTVAGSVALVDAAWAQVFAGTPHVTASPVPLYPGRVLKRGSTGEAVRHVQRYLELSASGTYNAATEAAVRAFQKVAGIEADGLVGPVTWASMFPS